MIKKKNNLVNLEYPMTILQVIRKWEQSEMLREIYFKWYDELFYKLDIKSTDKVLEICCGPGFFAEYLLKRLPYVNYTGIDYVPKIVRTAKKRVPGARFITGNVMEMAGKYDKIVCIDGLHHIENPGIYRKINRLLNKNGMFGAIEPYASISRKFVFAISKHHESIESFNKVSDIIKRMYAAKLDVTDVWASNAIDYPLSGGFSHRQTKIINRKCVDVLNYVFSWFPFLCWKYGITVRK